MDNNYLLYGLILADGKFRIYRCPNGVGYPVKLLERIAMDQFDPIELRVDILRAEDKESFEQYFREQCEKRQKRYLMGRPPSNVNYSQEEAIIRWNKERIKRLFDDGKGLSIDMRKLPRGRVAITYRRAKIEEFITHEGLAIPEGAQRSELCQILCHHLADTQRLIVHN